MSYRLRPRAEIEAAIASPDFNALLLTRKRQLAEQVIAVQLDLDLVLPVLIGQAGTDLEARFLLALVIQVDGSGNPTAPVAAFTATPASGQAPLSVLFADGSSGDISSRLWNFGEGTTSTERNPLHVFGGAGSFDVHLTVSGPGGTRTAVRTLTVTAAPAGGGGGGGGASSNGRYGLVPITQGADRVQIVFDPPFTTQPLGVWCSVQRNGQGEDNLAHAGIVELTRAGCVAMLSAAAPGTDYRLAWQALPSLGTGSSGPYGDLPMGGSLL